MKSAKWPIFILRCNFDQIDVIYHDKESIAMNTRWKPSEIIINRKVEGDPVTQSIIAQCHEIPIKFISDADPKSVVQTSEILSASGSGMLNKILAGKRVLFIAPAAIGTVDTFSMPDDRILCPHFNRLKLASNGCFYQCDWCYLKLTYRAAFPFITVRAEYDRIINQIEKKLSTNSETIIFNSGELADSLALEHLTGAGRKFIPWFGTTENGYLFMLTKSDKVDNILDLQHNGHTIIAWSMNNEWVSRKFEIGAPPFERRLNAARKVQEVGYPLRIRLDPIVPFDGWQRAYAETIKAIFEKVRPERVTLGTLRFEDEFYKMRNSIFTSGSDLPAILKNMQPMFEPKLFPGKKRPSIGKWSFTEEKRIEIFKWAIKEIRKYSDCKIALCKESANVWDCLDLDRSECSCVCQLDYADMS
jgi:spore photoproduct lyase